MDIYAHIPKVYTLSGVAKKQGRHPTETDLDCVEDATVVVEPSSQTIEWIGKAASLPKKYQGFSAQKIDSEVWLPGLVECHTHLVYGGCRHHDYALRSQGLSYQQIASQGGGILSTVLETRKATYESLVVHGLREVRRFVERGVSAIEIKSGYGLSLESEIKILSVIGDLQKKSGTRIVSTFLPAHAVPPEFRNKTDAYVDLICEEWLPEVAQRKLSTFFDLFLEEGYFNLPQARKLLRKAKDCGYHLKLHTDQFNDLKGVELGLELGAVSLDHLDCLSGENALRIGKSNAVAVLCPGASLFTKTPYAPARALIDAGAIVALSTDYNPGTCPSTNLPLMTTLACSAMQMTIPEALSAVTYNAARALSLQDDYGSLEAGKKFAVLRLQSNSYESLPYSFGEVSG